MKLTTEKIAQTLGCSYTGADYPLDHVVCDSREVTAGTLFVAIAGEKHDGHAFIRELDARYENLAYLITQPLDFVPRSRRFGCAIYAVRWGCLHARIFPECMPG